MQNSEAASYCSATELNSSVMMAQTLMSHRGHGSLVTIEAVVKLICLLSCMASAIRWLNKKHIQMNTTSFFTIIRFGNAEF